jgi:hypothetical protein
MLEQVMGGSSPERGGVGGRHQSAAPPGCGLAASLDVLVCRADWEYHLRAPEVSQNIKICEGTNVCRLGIPPPGPRGESEREDV